MFVKVTGEKLVGCPLNLLLAKFLCEYKFIVNFFILSLRRYFGKIVIRIYERGVTLLCEGRHFPYVGSIFCSLIHLFGAVYRIF